MQLTFTRGKVKRSVRKIPLSHEWCIYSIWPHLGRKDVTQGWEDVIRPCVSCGSPTVCVMWVIWELLYSVCHWRTLVTSFVCTDNLFLAEVYEPRMKRGLEGCYHSAFWPVIKGCRGPQDKPSSLTMMSRVLISWGALDSRINICVIIEDFKGKMDNEDMI